MIQSAILHLLPGYFITAFIISERSQDILKARAAPVPFLLFDHGSEIAVMITHANIGFIDKY